VFDAAGDARNDPHGADRVAVGIAVGIQRVPDNVYAGQAAEDDPTDEP
jgi:hypothetical protein